jgi:hypothetical protein
MDATTHRIIGTTLWFVILQDWIIICNFQKPLHFVQITLFSYTKLYQCLAFVSVTIDATTHRIIGTTLWFVNLQDWIIICNFQKPLHFAQITLFSHTKLYQCLAFVSVTIDATTPTIICTTLWISSLEVWRNISCFHKFTAFSSLVGFSPSTHPAHPHLHLICVVSGTFL